MNLPTLYSLAANAAENASIAVVDEEGYSYVWAVVITGLSVVFLGLIILILFVWLMGKTFTAIENRDKSKAPAEIKAEKPQPIVAPVKQSSVKPASKSEDEIIAVIAAAVAAMGEADGKKYKLKSVKAVRNKASRPAWSVAGLQSDTAPF